MTSYFQLIILALLLLLPILYESSAVFRYYTKFTVYCLGITINATILWPIFMFRPWNVRNLKIGGLWCRPISKIIGIKWTLRGEEYISQDKPYVIVANHQSSLDILGMLDIWHIMDKCTVVAKRELFYAWPFGLAAWLCNIIFIDRKSADKSRSTLNNMGDYLKGDRVKLWVFPEGTRRNSNDIHAFKKGAFHIAISEQLPILPVVFSSYSLFLDSKRKIFDNGEIIITTLPPISTAGMTTKDIDALMEKTKGLMKSVYLESTAEMNAKFMKTKISSIEKKDEKASN
ncbi:1-acyl-sn-glycerol-3-phosphate acyltransferase alpha [Phlebotomus argentipes]|uniref:1-acyl-sn-glycerol-3-phosphate acyltransferase alpha n=1 Tax=Phlebotomus argentipes TaxID=94469 RepID=UPI002892A467|nr:1-acyl-sn-glycerol-3-phosphate acyltransferase alpha [Phlebotomus argentipes]